MIPQTLVLPILVGLGLAVALVAGLSIAFFLSSRKQLLSLREEIVSATAEPARLTEVASEIEQLQKRLVEVEERRSPLAAEWSSEPSSLNLNRRGQVLRLYRRGEPSAQIASALGLSQGEVTLIIKVHELTRSGAGENEKEKNDDRPLIPQRIFDTNTRGRQRGGRYENSRQ